MAAPDASAEAGGRVVVDVQVVRDRSGNALSDQLVQHVYASAQGLITRMEIRK